ncbi:Mad3/BUB1 homology region 1 [Nesidiocoris tenuis]|uniref:Mad3/BUB1 homology region 1 n=1 Tax=Nesidiocoris tenuis TaxID=355587 RepID=A0ABN7AAR4_9HEMI|nr:Mad3/BUB1 homology region 1 [Nesidiocoris tenuis]
MPLPAVVARKEQLNRDIASYKGDDPLKLHYDFLLSLEKDYGKDHGDKDVFAANLEETLNSYWDVPKYKNDPRLISLLITFANMQPNPSMTCQNFYERGVAQQSSALYVNWAMHLASEGDFFGADKIFKLGSEKVCNRNKGELTKEYKNFLELVGRKYLDGELPLLPSKQTLHEGASKPDAAFVWEMNPGKAGEWTDFQVPVAYFEPPDPRCVRMYPRDRVYKDEKEVASLEELKAMAFYERRKKAESKSRDSSSRSAFKDNHSTSGTTSKEGNFPTPLLHCSGKEDSIAQSFTCRTKMAMKLVQDMWSSPSPAGEENSMQPKIVADREAKGGFPFHVYTDENCDTPKAAEKPPGVVKGPTTFAIYTDSPDSITKGSGMKASVADPGNIYHKGNILSERNVMNDCSEEPKTAIKQQLVFEDPQSECRLSDRMKDVAVSENVPFQPFGGIKPLFPVEQGKDDFSDITCNTKAFNFALPSSTPVQNKKSELAAYRSQNQVANRNEHSTQQNLSVILEASKERYSSSDVPRQLTAEDLNDFDPFCPILIEKLLNLLNFPMAHHMDGYYHFPTNLPPISKTLNLGKEIYTTFGDLGKGAYARVVKASIDKMAVALKIEKPACKWEFYIAKEIQKRTDSKARPYFMNIHAAYVFGNGSILVNDWARFGSLLNVINQFRQATGKVLEPAVAMHFSIEMMNAIDYLHKCKIIHGDIKPDNFVVRSLPSVNENEPCVALIDFGRSIDMSLFPEGTQFSRVVITEGFQCIEMKERRPWTYQTDLYGLAASIYCLLIGDYMKVIMKNDEWKLQKSLPRHIRRDLWDPIFHALINVPSCEQLPNLSELRKPLEDALNGIDNFRRIQYYNHVSNVLLAK